MEHIPHSPTGEGKSFYNLGIAPNILTALEKLGFKVPTPIQHQAIPIAIAGKDEPAAKCFAYLAGVVKEAGIADADAVGIFSALEKARLLRRGTSTAAQDKFRIECGPLAADLMILFAKQGATRGLGGGLF